MKRNLLSLLLIGSLCLTGTIVYSQTSSKKPSASPVKKFDAGYLQKDAFVFFVIGDWGRNGESHQSEVAASMKRCAEIADPEFIVSTGDNFYTYGVASVDDPQWMSSFENVYKSNSLQIDWHPVLGNHDYHGSVKAQIDYTKKSRRWVLPSHYYTLVKKTDDDKRIRFVFMDTNPYVQKYRKKGEEYPELLQQDTLRQWKWMDSVFAVSAAEKEEWKIVVGHHPIYSSSPKHGDTKELKGTLLPKLEANHVQAYFCGHDHDLQHQKPKGSHVDHFLSGAGSEVRPTGSYEHTLFAKSVPGFALVSIQGETLTLYYLDKEGNIVYQYTRQR